MSDAEPASYGDVTAEYLALRRRAGLVEGSHAALWVRGPDTVRFLQDLVSQEVAAVVPGAVTRSLLLSPQGKLRAVLWLLRGEEEVGLITETPFAEQAREDLARYRIRVQVDIERDPRPVLEVWGPQGETVLADCGLVIGEGWTRDGERVVASAALGPLPRRFVLGVPPADLAAAGAIPAGGLAVRAVRVEAGEPRMGIDIDEKTIPQESGLVPATVSFTKGCYLGQELVARIDSRGHVNRSLRGVLMTENLLPPHGAEVVVGERVMGTLTSVAESLTLRAPAALCLLRREVVAGDEVEIRWEGGVTRGRVQDLPLDDFTDS